ncbi:hypothetical protein D3C72_2483760 [compost metagenome]
MKPLSGARRRSTGTGDWPSMLLMASTSVCSRTARFVSQPLLAALMALSMLCTMLGMPSWVRSFSCSRSVW